jgi:hypothetical protein
MESDRGDSQRQLATRAMAAQVLRLFVSFHVFILDWPHREGLDRGLGWHGYAFEGRVEIRHCGRRILAQAFRRNRNQWVETPAA